jgi:hypothetical protein
MGNEDVASNKFVRILVVAFFVAAVAAVSLFLAFVHPCGRSLKFLCIIRYRMMSGGPRIPRLAKICLRLRWTFCPITVTSRFF